MKLNINLKNSEDELNYVKVINHLHCWISRSSIENKFELLIFGLSHSEEEKIYAEFLEFGILEDTNECS